MARKTENVELEEVFALLRREKSFLKREYKVKRIGIFGSYIRGEQVKGSDLDILIEKDEAIGLLKLANLKNYLSRLVGLNVDLVNKKSLKPRIGENILREVVYV